MTEMTKSAIVLCGACHQSMGNNVLGYWQCENGDCPQCGVTVGQDEDEDNEEEEE